MRIRLWSGGAVGIPTLEMAAVGLVILLGVCISQLPREWDQAAERRKKQEIAANNAEVQRTVRAIRAGLTETHVADTGTAD